MTEFVKWGSTARLFRDVTVTEKIDGTNACIIFERLPQEINPDLPALHENDPIAITDLNGGQYAVHAQSRNRLITPFSDNQGFAKWVVTHAYDLLYVLGEGRHYGEWWGQGINRGYDMDRKVFSVFNTAGWHKVPEGMTTSRADRRRSTSLDIDCIPVLDTITFSEDAIRDLAEELMFTGSRASAQYTGKAFAKPEGVCIYHKAADTVFKYTFDNHDQHKWMDAPAPERTLIDRILRRK